MFNMHTCEINLSPPVILTRTRTQLYFNINPRPQLDGIWEKVQLYAQYLVTYITFGDVHNMIG